MIQKLKDFWTSTEPKVLTLIGLAPFAAGLALGYLFHGPMSWVVGLVLKFVKIF